MRPRTAVLLYVGMGLVAAGFVLLWFTWGQVAGLESVALQLPYLVSGGLTGLGFIIVGATAVNIHAKRREAVERERQAEQLLEILRQVSQAMGGASGKTNGDDDGNAVNSADIQQPDGGAKDDATEDLSAWAR